MENKTLKRGLVIFLAVLVLTLLVKCIAGGEDTPTGQATPKTTAGVLAANPQQVILDVYATLPESRTEPLTDRMFAELFPGLEDCVQTYDGRISDPTGGLADVLILRPLDGETDGRANRDVVHDTLRIYQDTRIREFENYDILDALSIATNAEVFVQGDYVILLMLPDNESARSIIDQYIPL